MPNRLASATSPYLLQHAENPVDWYPWGEEALGQARQEERPIFLSIGYAACHWCHVMEHESFENPAIASVLNENFVCIKVDREERPDLDQIYMQAVQIMTGRGGWPMSVFLTPDCRPFYGGTYWPPEPRHGMPGFDQVLAAVIDAWQNRRPQAEEQADKLTAHIEQAGRFAAARQSLPRDAVHTAAAHLERVFDFQHGGFGGAPKFPHPMDLRVLLRAWRREPREGLMKMVSLTLDKMAAGGIYDHLGGGFHRYSVDERWLVPHFEKMLYDNALLAVCYLEGYQATGRTDYARVARETLDFWLDEMTDPAGGFYSTLDADSEGVEGRYYVWTPEEIEGVLGAAPAKAFSYVYDVSPGGNFEGQSILNCPKTLQQCAAILNRDADELATELQSSRAKLRGVRAQRVRPGCDDKVLVSWNALLIDALAMAGAVLAEPRYTQAAEKAAGFLLDNFRRDDGRLWHTWRAGQATLDAYLDDYACLAQALVTLYETTFQARWIETAVELADIVLAHFADAEGGGFYYTADDHEKLIARQKDIVDSSVPSGNAMAATVLLRLGKLTGRSDYLDAAQGILETFAALVERSPAAAGQLLLAADFAEGPTPEIILVGDSNTDPTRAALADLHSRFLPNRVLACRDTNSEQPMPAPLAAAFAGKEPGTETPAVYICEQFTCQEPGYGLEAAKQTWERLAGAAAEQEGA